VKEQQLQRILHLFDKGICAIFCAIVTADIFDPEGMKQALSDAELGKSFEEMGIEHTIYMLQPAPVPGS